MIGGLLFIILAINMGNEKKLYFIIGYFYIICFFIILILWLLSRLLKN